MTDEKFAFSNKTMQRLHVPTKGCATCPYRRDTPPGIWAPEEYEKLRSYDSELDELEDPSDGLKVFHCHQENVTGVPTVCRGWLSVHQESVAVRLACAIGAVTPGDVPLEREGDYYSSGHEAADAGLAGVDDPSHEARLAQNQLLRKGTFVLRDDA